MTTLDLIGTLAVALLDPDPAEAADLWEHASRRDRTAFRARATRILDRIRPHIEAAALRSAAATVDSGAAAILRQRANNIERAGQT